MPSSHLRRIGLGLDATPFDAMEARRAAGTRGLQTGGMGLEGGPGFVKTVTFDEHHEPRELRLHPTQTMRGYPRLVEAGSELFDQAMERAIERCKSYGVTAKVGDGAALVQVK